MRNKILSVKKDISISSSQITKTASKFVVDSVKNIDKMTALKFLRALIREEPLNKENYRQAAQLLLNYCAENEDYIPLLSDWFRKLEFLMGAEFNKNIINQFREDALVDTNPQKVIALRSLTEYQMNRSMGNQQNVSLEKVEDFIRYNLALLHINVEAKFLPVEDVEYLLSDVYLLLQGLYTATYKQQFNKYKDLYVSVSDLIENKFDKKDKEMLEKEIKEGLKEFTQTNGVIHFGETQNILAEKLNDFLAMDIIPDKDSVARLRKQFVVNLVMPTQQLDFRRAIKNGDHQIKKLNGKAIMAAIIKHVNEIQKAGLELEILADVDNLKNLILYFVNQKEPDINAVGLLDHLLETINKQYFDTEVYPVFKALIETKQISEIEFDDFFPLSLSRKKAEFSKDYQSFVETAKTEFIDQIRTIYLIEDDAGIKWSQEKMATLISNIVIKQHMPKQIPVEEFKQKFNLSHTQLEDLINKGVLLFSDEEQRTVVFNNFMEDNEVFDLIEDNFPLSQFSIASYWMKHSGAGKLILNQLFKNEWQVGDERIFRSTTLEKVCFILERMMDTIKPSEKKADYLKIIEGIKSYILNKYAAPFINEHKVFVDTLDPSVKATVPQKYNYHCTAALLYKAMGMNKASIEHFSGLFKNHVIGVVSEDINSFYTIPGQEKEKFAAMFEKTPIEGLPDDLKAYAPIKLKKVTNFVKLAITMYAYYKTGNIDNLDMVEKLFKFYIKLQKNVHGKNAKPIQKQYKTDLKALSHNKELKELYAKAFTQERT